MWHNPLFQRILSILSYVGLAIITTWLIMDRFSPTLKVGETAPILETFTHIDGTKSSFKNLLGKPLVINFWATWCNACLKELPTLSKASNDTRVNFFGAVVSSRPQDIIELKNRFLLNYDQGFVSDSVVEKWQAQALPTTYVLNSLGQIIWAKAGVVSESELNEAIDLALKR